MSLSPQRPATATEWVTTALREEILTGRIKQSSLVRQEEIAERFGVSRMPVREAIRRLSAEGWIVERPNRMAVIASLDPDDARELYTIRAELECLAIRESLPQLTSHAKQHMEFAYHALVASKPERYTACHLAFHLALYAGAGPRLRDLIANHIMLSERYLHFERTELVSGAQDAAAHQALLEVAVSADAEKASALLRHHILDGASIARAILGKRESRE